VVFAVIGQSATQHESNTRQRLMPSETTNFFR
jgi:hypothetical protein